MNNKLKNMEVIILIGTIILLFAGVIAFFNDTNGILNVCIMLFISVLFLLLSNVYQNTFNDLKKSNIYYYIGLAFIILSFLNIGTNELVSSYFSTVGEGRMIFFASLSILIGILAMITYLRNKNYYFIHIVYISIIMMIYFLLMHFKIDYYLLILGLNIILLILAIIKNSKVFDSIVYIVSGISLLVVSANVEEPQYIKLILISVITLINFIFLLFRKKDVYKLLSICLILINVFVIYIVLNDVFDSNILLVITMFILCVIELIISSFNLIDNKALKIIYKVYNNIFILYILIRLVNFNYLVPTLIVLFMYLINNIVISKVYKDAYEGFLTIFKIIISIYVILNILPISLDTIWINTILNSIMILCYSLTKKDMNKKSYLGMIIILLIGILLSNTSKLFEYFIYVLILILDYYVVVYRSQYKDKLIGFIVYTFLLLYVIYNGINLDSIGLITLVSAIIVSLFAYLFRNVKYNLTISLVGIVFLINHYLTNTLVNANYALIVTTIIIYVVIIVLDHYVIENPNKYLIYAILLSVWFYNMGNDLIISLFIMISSIIGLFIGVKNKEYKYIYQFSLVWILLSLIKIIFNITNISTSIFLLIVGFIIIVVGSVMIYKYKGSEEEKYDTILEKKHVIKYCGSCGSSIKSGDLFCGKCGKRL